MAGRARRVVAVLAGSRWCGGYGGIRAGGMWECGGGGQRARDGRRWGVGVGKVGVGGGGEWPPVSMK